MEEDKTQLKQTIRHDWYQTDTHVIVTILIRNVKPDDIKVNYSETNLYVVISLPSEETYNLHLQLAHKICPQKCVYKVMSTKVEIKLPKVDCIHWNTLEGDSTKIGPMSIPQNTTHSEPLKYPTSKVGRDWNAIEKEITKELNDENLTNKQSVNQLFQKIYGEGSDEVKKAMNKSYLESGGTVLSTNWNEIKKDKVPIKPPDGMEWKEWNN